MFCIKWLSEGLMMFIMKIFFLFFKMFWQVKISLEGTLLSPLISVSTELGTIPERNLLVLLIKCMTQTLSYIHSTLHHIWFNSLKSKVFFMFDGQFTPNFCIHVSSCADNSSSSEHTHRHKGTETEPRAQSSSYFRRGGTQLTWQPHR